MELSRDFLYEGEVQESVMTYLKEKDWSMESFCTVDQKGIDIVAVKSSRTLHIEVKGAGSSKPSTNRSGNSFSSGQVASHVARAIYSALKALDRGVEAAIALPATDRHKREVDKVRSVLAQLDITIFWVNLDRTVSLDRTSPLD